MNRRTKSDWQILFTEQKQSGLTATAGDWDLPEDLSLVPKVHDFAITGIIAGPGCPGVTEPPSETNLFAGTGFRVEPENINKLLQYRSPQKDRFHVDAGTKETTLHIFYSEDMDVKTFKVQPAWMKYYFFVDECFLLIRAEKNTYL